MKAIIAQSDLVTSYGWGMDALWNGLNSGKTAITSTPKFANGSAVKVAMVPDLNVEPGESRARAMVTRLLQPLIGKISPETTLIFATTVCEIEFIERAVLEQNPELAGRSNPGLLLNHIKQLLGLRGPAMVMSSACASSSSALGSAASMIQAGAAKTVLMVSCDAVSQFVFSGFSTLLSLCDTPAKPFDASRCGLSLGEAAAWALVTADDSPLAGNESVAILGWSSTADAVHMTAPDREARGLSRAIRSACGMADITPEQINFIAAHGTATIYNDAMELRAFRNCIPNPIPIFSIKGGTGHTLAAAGLVQILVSARAMNLHTVPPTVGLSEPDAEALEWAHGDSIQLAAHPVALSTNSGFGGVNTAVLLGPIGRDRPEVAKSATPSILAASWFCADDHGVIAKDAFVRQSPLISDSKEMTALIDRPVKYFPRMTVEARSCLAAASLAIKAVGWHQSESVNIGILGTGYTGCLLADLDYFRDYVAGGQSLGRANLFIYTLPTSALSEVAIALNLTGPTLHVCDDTGPMQSLFRQAMSMVKNCEATGMICVYSDGPSAICVAIGEGEPIKSLADCPWNQSPEPLCRSLAAMVPKP